MTQAIYTLDLLHWIGGSPSEWLPWPAASGMI